MSVWQKLREIQELTWFMLVMVLFLAPLNLYLGITSESTVFRFVSFILVGVVIGSWIFLFHSDWRLQESRRRLKAAEAEYEKARARVRAAAELSSWRKH